MKDEWKSVIDRARKVMGSQIYPFEPVAEARSILEMAGEIERLEKDNKSTKVELADTHMKSGNYCVYIGGLESERDRLKAENKYLTDKMETLEPWCALEERNKRLKDKLADAEKEIERLKLEQCPSASDVSCNSAKTIKQLTDKLANIRKEAE
jgi:predicted RNase H-like nuclease (RuvC/YqgF family)